MAAALAGRAEHLLYRRFEAVMSIRDDKLDPAQTPPCERT